MPGTVSGGKKAAAKNKELYGDDFYRKIGQVGGKKSKGGGFAANPTLAALSGKLGGMRKNQDPNRKQVAEMKKVAKQIAALKKETRHEEAHTN